MQLGRGGEDGEQAGVEVAGPVLEQRDGRALRRVPLPDLPLGWHLLRAGAARSACSSPHPPGIRCRRSWTRTWGWMVQLYGLRSADSWAVGDYADLRTVVERHRRPAAAASCSLNPLHAETPVPPLNPSPYSPSSRLFRSPLWLRVQDVQEYGTPAPSCAARSTRCARRPTRSGSTAIPRGRRSWRRSSCCGR